MGKFLLRLFLSLPITAVGAGLCVTIIGIPIGLPILMWVGAFISKPIRRHPKFNIDPTIRTDDSDIIAYYHEAENDD